MALSMECNVAQMFAAASLGDTYSGPIFNAQLSRINLAKFAGWRLLC